MRARPQVARVHLRQVIVATLRRASVTGELIVHGLRRVVMLCDLRSAVPRSAALPQLQAARTTARSSGVHPHESCATRAQRVSRRHAVVDSTTSTILSFTVLHCEFTHKCFGYRLHKLEKLPHEVAPTTPLYD